jgi:alpha-beta hydrolase superfamily lysophospholipase
VIPGSLTASDGTELRTRAWHAEDPRGRVLLVHGLGEHGGRYDLLARALGERGYSCLIHDLRGHGESGGKRGWVRSFDVFAEDLALVAGEAERSLPGEGPLIYYGHSMGGLVLTRYLQIRRPEASAVILSAPWFGTAVAVPWWKEQAAALLRVVAPALPVPTAIDPAQLTRDPALQRAFREDPLIEHGISVGLYDASLAAQEQAMNGPPIPAVPTLVLLPLADPIVSVPRTEQWVQRSGPHVEVLRLPDTLHEPHNDVGREEVYRRVADWLDARTPAARPGNPRRSPDKLQGWR